MYVIIHHSDVQRRLVVLRPLPYIVMVQLTTFYCYLLIRSIDITLGSLIGNPPGLRCFAYPFDSGSLLCDVEGERVQECLNMHKTHATFRCIATSCPGMPTH